MPYATAVYTTSDVGHVRTGRMRDADPPLKTGRDLTLTFFLRVGFVQHVGNGVSEIIE